MPALNTASVSLAVTPTVVSTLFSHYLNRKPLKQRPTAHLSYDEGLHLIRSFLDFASHHTIEELQSFTSQWVPSPQWVKVQTVQIEHEHLKRSGELLLEELGSDGSRLVGGRDWWDWRQPGKNLEAEWIEMRAHAKEREKRGHRGRRVMLYVHGGAYFFGSVDEHRYQMQRHARKLKARVFAPKYRLAPQFPFPCGLQDCLAAYLYLLTIQDPSTIIVAGDSAGGGMVMALLCVLRDSGTPMPAGGILISPWVDLTHSFPSIVKDAPLDYIPQCGFHYKPSRSWPPPNDDDLVMLQEEADKKRKHGGSGAASTHQLKQKQQAPVVEKGDGQADLADRRPLPTTDTIFGPSKSLSVEIDGTLVTIKDQIQIYTTNQLLDHPLVSPIMQPSLGGLPPLLIMVGGGEILRDEQIYLAHKCANPAKYSLPMDRLSEQDRERLAKYEPTDVQLQVWDDLCHVAPTLSFTRPAKYMYRSVAQFGAWALARAQRRGIEIMDDEAISVISSSDSTTEAEHDSASPAHEEPTSPLKPEPASGEVGKAGDPLPRFVRHMIRQRVTRHGVTLPLEPEEELPGCTMDPSEIGRIKAGPVKKFMDAKRQWESRYASAKARVHKKIIDEMVSVGYMDWSPFNKPPPTALARRFRPGEAIKEKSRTKSLGLAIWSLWGSSHDEATVERETVATHEPETQEVEPDEGQEDGFPPRPPFANTKSRSRSGHRVVVDENQTGVLDKDTPIAALMHLRQEESAPKDGGLNPESALGTGTAGKRPHVDGIAMPFSLNKEAETASMMTLQSTGGLTPMSRPQSPAATTDPRPSMAESVQPNGKAVEDQVLGRETIP